ncbi:U-actitoxin-Avd3f-like isoform X2 [Ornithodoros turicata]|uniref:U-actitoxin-Avd3f-like isoform X2 n=1 Tax=Ornithodoros turicata TaxID=34597 RepID=UPI00313955E7
MKVIYPVVFFVVVELTSGLLLRPKPPACTASPDPGPCKAHVRRYYFNATSGRCEEFIYGGCYGNSNNYKRIVSCYKNCANLSHRKCLAPLDVGNCSAEVERYYFDVVSGECQKFVYTGCEGNENNYADLGSCQRVCSPQP